MERTSFSDQQTRNSVVLDFRKRSDRCYFCFYYLLGVVIVCQLIDDIVAGQGKIYSGEFFPWRQYLSVSTNLYWLVVTIEISLICCYFLRIKIQLTTVLLALLLFFDNLVSFLNHRLLLAIEVFVVGLSVPKNCEKPQLYWNLDLIRWQFSLMLLFTGLHKINAQFISGESLHNLFWQIENIGWRNYPTWLLSFLENKQICQILSILVICIEITLAFALNFCTTVKVSIFVALVTFLSFAYLVPHTWIFALQSTITLLVFFPEQRAKNIK
ncbi:hypothetical protein [Candidatus Uabimicrobium sp. HlEnr_7]|uniref:hypothetical protein n=1 Tax=Candidatus Uabimicrobium helgolandensis TaxID=3095367 RepID=UPI003556962B